MDELATPFENSTNYMQSLVRGLEVLRAFDLEHPAMTLSEVAERVGLARAVVRRCLLTLQHLGYIGSRGRQFHLLPKTLDLGFRYISSLSLPDRALPFMEQLAKEVDESSSLAVLDGLEIVYVARVPVRRVMTIALAVGARLPAFATSMGRVLLAGLPDPVLADRLRKADLKAITARTVWKMGPLKAEITKVRKQGYALVYEELELGLCSIAVPIYNHARQVAGALNIGFRAREGCREWALATALPALREAQAQIAAALAHYPAPGVQ